MCSAFSVNRQVQPQRSVQHLHCFKTTPLWAGTLVSGGPACMVLPVGNAFLLKALTCSRKNNVHFLTHREHEK